LHLPCQHQQALTQTADVHTCTWALSVTLRQAFKGFASLDLLNSID